MAKKIGFVILSHNHPLQLLRLVRTLQRVYDNPPIVCHHDFAQSPALPNEFPPEVRFVSPHVRTRWGRFSVVTATLRALEILYREAAPDWFFLLSGADYPTMRSEKVVQELTASGADTLLDFREVLANPSNPPYPAPENPALQHFVSPGNAAIAWHRYKGFHAWFPIISRGPKIRRHIINLPFEAWRSPFNPQFKCFYGDHWFTGKQKVAEILLRPSDKHMQLRRYLRWRASADECYYHTVLGNTPNLKINRATRRFAKWLGGGAHPRILEINDLPEIISSDAYFARKFAPDSQVLDEIDRMLSV
jgi:hypothetical protein